MRPVLYTFLLFHAADTKTYVCSICLTSFSLSGALFVHKLQIHSPSKISQFLDILLPNETLHSSDDEYDYTFEVNISYERLAIINVKEEEFVEDVVDEVISSLTTLKVEKFVPSEEDSIDAPVPTPVDTFVPFEEELLNSMDKDVPTPVETLSKRSQKRGHNWNATCKLCAKPIRPCNMARHLRVAHSISTADIDKISPKLQKESLKKRKQEDPTEPVQLSCQTCHICGMSLLAANMKRHLQAAHKLGPEKLTSIVFKIEKENKNVFTCPICKETYEIMVDLRAHYSEFHPTPGDETKVFVIGDFTDANRHWRCTICNYVSDFLYRCVQHIQKDHKDVVDRIEANVNESFGCHLCQASLKPFDCFVHHVKNEHKAKTPHQCTQCGEILVSAFRLKTHIVRKHSDLRPYICDVCDKSFKEKYTLFQHILIHIGRKSYVCQVTGCGADFSYASGLRQHVSLHHNEEKRFECGECGKIFKLGNHLK